MSKQNEMNGLTRRKFLQLAGGGAVLAAAGGLIPFRLNQKLLPVAEVMAAAPDQPADLLYAGTDGWIALPREPAIGFYNPDSLAPADQTTYIFGFRNLTWHAQQANSETLIHNQKFHAQHTAPLFWLDEFDPAAPYDFALDLTNLGLQQRPDLVDAHTMHWHGFRNVIPYFDGEPVGSVAVPIGRVFRYIFRPRDPGTYMFHCHVEDTEHVHMGMTGVVFVRALQNKYGAAGAPVARLAGGADVNAPMGYAYDDGVALNDPKSTAYDREFVLQLSEVWAEAHWDDAHIQLPDWTDYRPDFGMINGRCYPDTLKPNSPFNELDSEHAYRYEFGAEGDLPNATDHPTLDARLQYQPLSALVECKESEKVLLRLVNLGFMNSSMTIAGAPLRVVGKDATMMRGRDGTSTSYETNTVSFGAGESVDAIFTAPAFSGGLGNSGHGYDAYVLYNRELRLANNLATDALGFGGQRTEIRVYPSSDTTLVAQKLPNQLFHAVV